MIIRYILIAVSMCLSLEQVQSTNILALIQYSGKSHYIFQKIILEELALRGYNVTVVTSYEENNPVNDNYKQIVVDKTSIWETPGKQNPASVGDMTTVELLHFLWNAGTYLTSATLNSASIKPLLEDKSLKFDLVITEIFYQEALYAFAHKYDAPLVTICTFPYQFHSEILQGNPIPLSILPHEYLQVNGDMNFIQRVMSMIIYIVEFVARRYYYIPMQERLIKKYFSDSEGNFPTIADLEKRVVLSLRNNHFSWDRITPNIPNVIDIGGVQLSRPVKTLPNDISKFIEESSNGVILFCLGSNVKSKDLDPKVLKVLITVLGRLKERVIWKFENDTFNVPSNILIKEWLPQFDILAHPNVKLFITHGGLLSIHEAIHHGVPTVGVPVFADQYSNVAKLKQRKMGVYIHLASITEESLNNALKEVLNNPHYANNAKKFSTQFRDRPMSALDTAIYWIEYVIKYKDSNFIKVPIRKLTFFKYYSLDVISILLLSVALIIVLILMTLKILVLRLTFLRKGNTKLKTF